MPATINEPLDFLQRLAESFEYVSLVDAAAAAPDSVTRMMLVAVWQLSCYNSQVSGKRRRAQKTKYLSTWQPSAAAQPRGSPTLSAAAGDAPWVRHAVLGCCDAM
eukprot:235153-Chlamydomonas_euryale.AAC.2